LIFVLFFVANCTKNEKHSKNFNRSEEFVNEKQIAESSSEQSDEDNQAKSESSDFYNKSESFNILDRASETENVVRMDSCTSSWEVVKTKEDQTSLLFEELKKAAQIFTVSPLSDTTLTGKEGTKLNIPAGIWVDKHGKKVTSEVRVELTEYYSKADIILANLSTSSNGMMLETGGMVYLKAFSGKEEVKIMKSGSIELKLPTSNYKDDMEIFYGTHNETDKRVNWIPAVAGSARRRQTSVTESRITLKKIALLKSGNDEGLLFKREYISAACDSCVAESRFYKNIRGVVTIDKSGTITAFTADQKSKTDKAWFSRERNIILPNRGFSRIFEKLPRNGDIDLNFMNGRKSGNIHLSSSECEKVRKELKTYGSATIFVEYSYIEGRGKEKELDYCKSKMLEKDIRSGEYSENMMSEYIFAVTGTGWINCDRFYKIPDRKKVEFAVSEPRSGGNINMVFSSINSVMGGNQHRNVTYFKSIPADEEVTLVAVRKENNQAYLCIKKCNTSQLKVNDLVYEPVSPDELAVKVRTTFGN
jgi:hypothetical protein